MDLSQRKLDLIKYITITRTPEQLLKVLQAQTLDVANVFALKPTPGSVGHLTKKPMDQKTADRLAKNTITPHDSILNIFRAAPVKPLEQLSSDYCGEFGNRALGNSDADPIHAGRQKATDIRMIDCAALKMLQSKLFAEGKRSVLIILQGPGASGKGAAVNSLVSTFNSLGVSVKSFQAPSAGEKEEIFTQRFDAHLPKIGTLKIFNRSLYESVTTEPLIQPITEEAYESICHKINDWEKNLSDNGVTVIKFYLHISHQEQKRRFARRLESRQTSWQLLEKIKGKSAFLKRRMWGKNKEYYEKSIINTNTNNAPWYIVPADCQWYRDWVISRVVREHLEELAPEYPVNPFKDRIITIPDANV